MSAYIETVIRCDVCDCAYDPKVKGLRSTEQRKEEAYREWWTNLGAKDYCHKHKPEPKGEA